MERNKLPQREQLVLGQRGKFKSCQTDGCDRKPVGRGLCMKHWQQYMKHGRVLTVSEKRVSPIHVNGAISRVELLSRYGEVVDYAVIDTVSLRLVEGYRWRSDKGKYAVTTIKGRQVYMHALLLPEAKMVDHKNRDGMDNRLCNLRPATPSQNGANKAYTGKNRFKGVRKRGNKYEAYISRTPKGYVYLGVFDSEVVAAKAYDASARESYGEFAVLNFP